MIRNVFFFLFFLGSCHFAQAQMVLSGDALGDCDCYTLTTTGNQAGSIWSPTSIDLTNSFDFTFNISLGASDGGADGMVFVLRSSGTSTGGLGSQLGYQGITESIGIEVDTWNSDPLIASGDIVQDHVGMDFDGGINHALVPAIAIPNIEDGVFHEFNVRWDPVAMEISVTLDGADLFTYTEDLVTTYFGGDPNVFFGWTGSTGGAFNIQEVCMYRTASFTFEPEEPCPGQEITFTSTSTGDLIYDGDTLTSWSWDFEPGETSDLEDPIYTFPSEGTKSVDLIVTDISGCTHDTTIFFDVRNLDPDILTFSDVSCFGSTDGSATVVIEPEDDTYTFSWDDPMDQTTEEATDLPPGTYTVTVINAEGCTGDTDVTIGEPDALTFGDIVISNSSCDVDDGSFLLSGEGGTPDYEYSVNGSPFSDETLYEGLGGGDFTVVIRDENGCTFEEIITMDASGLDLDYIFNQPTCFGFSDGSLTIITEGAGDGLVFEITDAAGTLLNEDNSNAANSLPTGWYYFYVEDESGCFEEDSVFIDQPGQLEADITTFDVRCYGDASGWARVDTVRNWQGDYDQMAYFWAPNTSGVEGIGADSTFNMTAGTYTLTLNDDNGCSRVYNFEITQPDSLYFVEFGMDPAFCRVFDYQNGNGQVFGAVSGGVADYDYLWTDLETGNTSINSTWGGRNPGDYELTATDQNGCIITQTITVDSLNPQAIFTVTSDQLNEDCKGTAPVEAFFYNNSINYANENDPLADTIGFWNLDTLTNSTWILTEDFDEVFDTIYLSRGQTYDVEVCLTVQNKNGCSDTECKTVTIFEDIVFDQVNVFSPNGDGVNDEFTFKYRSASIAELNCVIVNRWGVVVHEMNDINDAWDGTDRNGDPCASGVYFYTYEALTDNSVKLVGQGNIQLVRVEL